MTADPDRTLDGLRASPETAVRSLETLLRGAFDAQRKGLLKAFAELARQPEAAPDWIATVIGVIAEMVVGASLGQIAAWLARALPVSEASSRVIGSQMGRSMSRFGKAAGGVVASAGQSAEPGGIRAPYPVALGSDRLVDQYQARVDADLSAGQVKAEAQLILYADALAQLPREQLDMLVHRLAASGSDRLIITNGQYTEIMWGWMHLNAALALGPRQPGEPQIRGANGADVELSDRDRGLAAAAGTDGFIDVFVSCPETIDGVNGCKVERVAVNSHPAIEELVKDGQSSLLALPVHRKVFISSMNRGGGRWAAGPSFVLTPDGATEILPAAAALAAIGSGRVVAPGEIARGASHGNDAAGLGTAAALSHRAMWLAQATTGAEFVKDVLARTLPHEVMK